MLDTETVSAKEREALKLIFDNKIDHEKADLLDAFRNAKIMWLSNSFLDKRSSANEESIVDLQKLEISQPLLIQKSMTYTNQNDASARMLVSDIVNITKFYSR